MESDTFYIKKTDKNKKLIIHYKYIKLINVKQEKKMNEKLQV